MKRFLLSLVGVAVGATVSFAAAETHKIDASHSSVGFKIRHFFANVPGTFNDFEGAIIFDTEDPAKSKAEATIKTASIDTKNADRDKHLRSADFFDAEKHPAITFKSTAWKQLDKENHEVSGDLTIRGVTKPVTLKVKFLGAGPDAWGGHRSGWEAMTKIDRTAFGVSWNKAVEAGGMVLGNEVEITLNIEAIRQK
jgi:polyisoprenoid-binding protein YceI